MACLLALSFVYGILSLTAVHTVEVAIQYKLHAISNPWFYATMRALTEIGSIEIFVTALAIVLAGLVWRDHLRAAGILAYAIAGALVLNYNLKNLFHRARPELSLVPARRNPPSPSPAGHAFFSTVLYGTLCWLALRRGIPAWRVVPVAVVLPLAIGLSRVYLGEHYPTDVIAGWLCGAIWTLTVIRVARILAPPQLTPQAHQAQAKALNKSGCPIHRSFIAMSGIANLSHSHYEAETHPFAPRTNPLLPSATNFPSPQTIRSTSISAGPSRITFHPFGSLRVRVLIAVPAWATTIPRPP